MTFNYLYRVLVKILLFKKGHLIIIIAISCHYKCDDLLNIQYSICSI